MGTANPNMVQRLFGLIIILTLVAVCLPISGCGPDLSGRPPDKTTEPMRGSIDGLKKSYSLAELDLGLTVRGWAAGPGGVDRIEVFLNGKPVGCAWYGAPRRDVLAVFPDYDSHRLGYRTCLEITEPGRYELELRVYSRQGPEMTMNGGFDVH